VIDLDEMNASGLFDGGTSINALASERLFLFARPINPPFGASHRSENVQVTWWSRVEGLFTPHPNPAPTQGEGLYVALECGIPPSLRVGEGGQGDEG